MHRVVVMVVMASVGERHAGASHSQGRSDGERRGNACEQLHSVSYLTFAGAARELGGRLSGNTGVYRKRFMRPPRTIVGR